MSRLDPKNLPENIRKCMEPKLRKEMKALTLCEVFEKEDRKNELAMHREFEQWLRLNEIPFVHSRTDKKATTAVGTPDFVILSFGKGIAIELKGPGGQLTEAQSRTLFHWTQRGVPCLVATSVKGAIEFVKGQLDTPA
jgi:hypothetical protein